MLSLRVCLLETKVKFEKLSQAQKKKLESLGPVEKDILKTLVDGAINSEDYPDSKEELLSLLINDPKWMKKNPKWALENWAKRDDLRARKDYFRSLDPDVVTFNIAWASGFIQDGPEPTELERADILSL